MSTDTKRIPTLETTNRIVAFRCPPVLASAMEAAAAEGLCSISDVARQAVLKEMWVRGLIEKKEAAT
jgi:hypothetical protein